MTSPISGRTILITGASGIAAATARLAAQGGAKLFIASIDEGECRELAARLEEEGATIAWRAGDLTLEAEAIAAVARCHELFGRIDALFNVVGISGRRYGDGPIHQCTLDGWRRTMATNVETAFLTSREVVRIMLGQEPDDNGGRGAILNMASVLAISPEPGHFETHAYAASKGAIIGLTMAMAASYARSGIRVNAIAPGLTRTPMSVRAQSNPEILALMKMKQPLRGDLLEADDVARAALFLLGDDARSITGELLAVDGGWKVA